MIFYLNVILTIIHVFTCGYNLVARISCFRPDCTGSIPVTHSSIKRKIRAWNSFNFFMFYMGIEKEE